MKMINRENLINLLERLPNTITTISQGNIETLFKRYGDDYFCDPGMSPWELTTVNEETKKVLGNKWKEPTQYLDR